MTIFEETVASLKVLRQSCETDEEFIAALTGLYVTCAVDKEFLNDCIAELEKKIKELREK